MNNAKYVVEAAHGFNRGEVIKVDINRFNGL